MSKPERYVVQPANSNESKNLDARITALLTLCIIVLCILAVLFLNNVPDCRADQENDSFIYIALARDLLHGKGYQSKHWMPGFPLILTTIVGPFGADWTVLKLCMLLIAFTGILLSIRLFREYITTAALPLAAVLGSAPLFFDYAHRVMSEIPALTSIIGALVAMEKVKSSSSAKSRLAWGIVLALTSVAALLIRGNALALAPSFLVLAVRTHQRSPHHIRLAASAAMTCLLFTYIVWMIWCARRDFVGIHNVTYLQEVQAKDIGALWAASGKFGDGVERINTAELIQRIYKNTCWYLIYQFCGFLVPMADRLAEIEYRGVGLVLATFLAIPIVVGFFRLLGRSPELAVFLLASVVLVIIYPTGGARRMVLPFLPVLLLSGYMGIEYLVGPRAAIGWLICLLVSNISQCAIAADIQNRRPYSREGFADFVHLAMVELPKYYGEDDRVGAFLNTELYAIAGVPSEPINAVVSAVQAGHIDSALVLCDRELDEHANIGAEVLAKSGHIKLVRLRYLGNHTGR